MKHCLKNRNVGGSEGRKEKREERKINSNNKSYIGPSPGDPLLDPDVGKNYTSRNAPRAHGDYIKSPSGFFGMLFGDSSPFPEHLGLGLEASVGRCVGDSGPRHRDSQPSLLPRGGRACPAGRRGSRPSRTSPSPAAFAPPGPARTSEPRPPPPPVTAAAGPKAPPVASPSILRS